MIFSKKYPNVEYVVESEPLGTGGTFKFALKNHCEPFVGMNGDILTDCNMLDFVNSAKGNTMVVVHAKDAKDFGHVEVADGKIAAFKEKPRLMKADFVNAGIYRLDPAVLALHPRNSFSIEHDIFPTLVAEKKLNAYLHRGFWIDVGTEERLEKIKRGGFLNIPQQWVRPPVS